MTDDHQQLIDDCENRQSRMSAEDVDFIYLVCEQLREGQSLTRKQAATLDQIWERATAGG